MCVSGVVWTDDQNPRRLSILRNATDVEDATDLDTSASPENHPDSAADALQYRYRLEPTGWIDELIHRTREVDVTWTQDTTTQSGNTYQIPDESLYYLIGGRTPTGNGFCPAWPD
jgi:hypothetical protein